MVASQPGIAQVPTTTSDSVHSPMVQGDLFYLTQSGDLKRGAGLPIRLLNSPDTVLALLKRNCSDFTSQWSKLQKAMFDSHTTDKSRESLIARSYGLLALIRARADSIVGAYTVKSVSSGINAHYAFVAVPAGEYLVYASWPVMIGSSQHFYQWIVRTELHPGSNVTLDLDTSLETGQVVYCGMYGQ